MRHTAVIFDKERTYGERLAGYFNSMGRFMFDVIAFSDEGELKRFCREDKPQLLIIDEKSINMTEEIDTEEVIVLSGTGTRKDDSRFYVHKYQSGERIEKDILGFLSASDNIGSIVSRKNRMNLIAIYTPARDFDTTREGLELAKKTAKKYKTLYVDMESHSALSGVTGKSFEKDISDLMYRLESRGGSIGMQLYGICEHLDGLDILPSVKNRQDLIDISFEKWKELIEHIESDTDYEYVFLKLGDAVQGLYELLMLSDKVVTVSASDEISGYRIAGYEDILRTLGMEEIIEKTVRRWEVSDEGQAG